MSRTAVIVGAGIGGLAAAVALKRRGWRVRVVERAANPRELGFALLLAPNAMLALGELGLADAITRGGVVVTHGEMRRPDGVVLRRFDAQRVARALGAPTVAVLRPVLHGALLQAVGDDALALSHEVIDTERSSGGVEVRLASGGSVQADAVIAADGARSTLRQQLHRHEGAPRSSGLIALRGIAHGVVDHLQGTSGSQYFGRGIEGGLGRTSATSVYWYLSVRAADLPNDTRDPNAILERCLPRFHQPFRAIASATAPDDLRIDELFDRDPLDHWGAGRMTLLGDAAHPMLPHAGQGAAQALEDAVELGRALDATADVESALRAYEAVRTRRTATIVQLSRRNARMGSLANPIACWLRDTAIRLIPEAMILRSLIAINRPPSTVTRGT